jgi:hypothetical protein
MDAHSARQAPLAVPRALSDEEQALLARLLEDAFPKLSVLRRQAAGAVVTGECACGCGSIRLSPDCAVPPAALEDVVACAAIASSAGETVQARVRVVNGYLNELEILPER